MNTIIYLIRHGDVRISVNDDGQPVLYGPSAQISSEGRDEISKLGRYLHSKDIAFSKLYTSPNTRAIVSAYLLRTEVGSPPVIPIPELRAVRYPTWVGRPVAEFETTGGDIFVDEPLWEVATRMSVAFDKICSDVIVENKPGETIGIVMHGEELGILLHMLRNPGDDIPGMDEHVPSGEAYRIVISPEGALLEGAPIIPDEIHGGGVERR